MIEFYFRVNLTESISKELSNTIEINKTESNTKAVNNI